MEIPYIAVSNLLIHSVLSYPNTHIIDIIHNEKATVDFCPFCSEELMTEEELDEWREEMWDEEEEE